MAREVNEWIGKTDDTQIPARVKLRILMKHGGECVLCTLPIGVIRAPAYDHAVALINGGENRETNIQLLCVPCHRVKTSVDVAVKSSNARRLKKRLGLKPRRTIPGRKFDGTPIFSRWVNK